MSAKDLTDRVARELIANYDDASRTMKHVSAYELPSRSAVEGILQVYRSLIFPGYYGDPVARKTPTELRDELRLRIDLLRNNLRSQIYKGLNHKRQFEAPSATEDCPDCAEMSEIIADKFVAHLPELRKKIELDVQAHAVSDPAASGVDEVIFCYPGLYAIAVYRFANALRFFGARIIPRVMTEIAHEKTGIDIHPGATIGESFFIDHGTGIVIGETAQIGNHVRMYQGVTLGALSVHDSSALRGTRRHPQLMDNVVVYAGATILGGETVVGEGAVIGGNTWVTKSVPAGSRVTLNG